LRVGLASAVLLTILYNLPNLPLGQKINIFLAPIVDVVRAPARWAEDFSLWLHDRQSLQSDYRDLELRLHRQVAIHQELFALRAENKQLRVVASIGGSHGLNHAA